MKKSISIIGGGAAALFFASTLDNALFDVIIYEKNKTMGRKFLVAGKGGFNLTHGESIDVMVNKYSPKEFLKKALFQYDNMHFRSWLHSIGIPTFVGSSNRVFPIKGIKPIEVLKKITDCLINNKVQIKYDHTWIGWNNNNDLVFEREVVVNSDYVIFALGGGSWKITGSDGTWLNVFSKNKIKTVPFLASNCAFHIKWGKDFISTNEAKPLKNISITCEDITQKGELVITKEGLEGNAIYALSSQIQSQLLSIKQATIFLDLKPQLSTKEIHQRLVLSKKKRTTDILRKDIKLSTPQINILKSHLSKEDFLIHQILASSIKNMSLTIYEAGPIDKSISTTGGIGLCQLTDSFELIHMKNTFCIGEMLNWDAPTGGYLLQACYSMGNYLADFLNHRHRKVSI